MSFIFNFEHATWDDKVVNGLDFIQNYVLQVPFFLMTMMRYITPTLDNMSVSLSFLIICSFSQVYGLVSTLKSVWISTHILSDWLGSTKHTTRSTMAIIRLRYGIHTSRTCECTRCVMVAHIPRVQPRLSHCFWWDLGRRQVYLSPFFLCLMFHMWDA